MSARLRLVTSGAEEAPAGDAGGEDVARAALAGEQAAWSRLIALHDHRVVVALLGRGVPLDRARELAQETWLRLMQSQREGRLRELSLPGLAITQARFLAANEARHQHRVGPAWEGEASSRRTLEDDAIGKERLLQMARALAACPPRARAIFELVYDNPELGYAEIAGRLGLSVQRVKQTVSEVRKRLRTALEEEGA
jgi:RNA polymerase sigma-70 factor (ECF subfamily)